MKKLLLLTIIYLNLQVLHAQSITGVTIVPAFPTISDSITILVDCLFPSASCDQHTQDQIINGNNIDTWALHCIGMLTVLCPHTDTFHIGMLSAGVYLFTFQLDGGALPFPCTPGIIAGPSINQTFEVSTTTSDVSLLSGGKLTLYPNPADEHLTIFCNQISGQKKLRLLNQNGQMIYIADLSANQTIFTTSSIPDGLYFAEVVTIQGTFRKLFIVQH